MKPYDKKRKSRVDLYDIVNDINNPHTLTLYPFPEEYQLVCPVKGRPESVTYFSMTSWGDLCHINIQFRPNDNDPKFMHARIELKLHLKDLGMFKASNEDILNFEEMNNYRGDINHYKIGQFLIDIRRPLVNTRLVFRGFLTDMKTNQKRFATINLFLIAIGKVFDNLVNFDTEFVKKQFQEKEIFLEDSIEQWVQIKGQIKLEDITEPKDLYFWGLYVKSFEKLPLTLNHLVVWNHKGMGFHIVQLEVNDNSLNDKEYIYGHLNMGFGLYVAITELPWIQLASAENIMNCRFDINLSTINRSYSVEIENNPEAAIKFNNNLWGFPLKFKEYNGYGIWYRQTLQNFTAKGSFKIRNLQPFTQNERMNFVGLNDELAENELLTGGKGSSLAVLQEFSKLSSTKFQVPDALIVTSEAYEKFLSFYPNLKKNVGEFKKKILNCKGNQNEIKLECEKMQDAFKNNPFPNGLKEDFKKKVIQIFGEDFEEKANRFAVRSSAVGEDSEEMSAAGQMTTFLGISGFDTVCQSVISCWASQFGQTAVEYKRGYGQSLNSPMAVVIQKMVPSEVAGVMFTCSPLDGNERFITISASYGLGESVVSGQVEPDTYTVKVDVDNVLRKIIGIESVRIGAKKHAIHMESEDATKTEEISQEQQKSRCLNDDQVLELAKIGLEVHAHYGNARDIEFGLSDGVWYLLQSRPVTNLESLNEWEIMHETDTGLLSENECLSKANVGEVMPGASSYNLIEFIVHQWSSTTFANHCKISGDSIENFNPYYNIAFSFINNNAFFSFKTPVGIMGRSNPEHSNEFIHGFEYALMGHKNENIELFKDVFEKMPERKRGTMKIIQMFSVFIQQVLTTHKAIKKAYKKHYNYSIVCDRDKISSKEIFERILKELPNMRETLLNHMCATQVSMFNNATLYHFLATKSGIKDEHQILDLFSRITSSVEDVFSAQVPKRLLEISEEISEPEKFLELCDEEAVIFLKKTSNKFNEFLIEFGHRGYKEFDLQALQWGDDSKPLINTLKSLLKNREASLVENGESEEKIQKGYNLDDYPGLSFTRRKILEKFLIPKTHQGIRDRELGKNLLIKVYDQFRKIFQLLGDKLIEEGKIPDRDLIYFLLNDELREIIQHETKPMTILNAKNRLRLHPKKEAFRYDEENWGYKFNPRNLQPKKEVPAGAVKLTGVPISSGLIVARCCVAEALEDAKNIQKGDILITYSTDIGWSPYFAALGGLVTEIGGLVSHGAVIAREYGLPCLVGVNDATSYFQTGEMLMLDTSAGFIARIDSTTNGDTKHQENGISDSN